MRIIGRVPKAATIVRKVQRGTGFYDCTRYNNAASCVVAFCFSDQHNHLLPLDLGGHA